MIKTSAKIFAVIVSAVVCLCGLSFLAACGDETTDTYTVTFNANGGTYSDGTIVTATTDESGKVSLPETDPTRTDYTFSGYNMAADGTGSSVTANTVYTSDTTVYAQWTAVSSDDEPVPDNPGSEDGVTEYYFEAEYTDLRGLTADIGSGTAYGRELITSGTNASNASNGCYVDNFNVVGSSITYTITSDISATVRMTLIARSVETDEEIDPDLLVITVNGSEITYNAATITSASEQVSAISYRRLFTEVDIGDINLIEGENTIVLTIGEKSNTSGSGTYSVGLGIDAIVLASSDATLTWEPVTEDMWDVFYL